MTFQSAKKALAPYVLPATGTAGLALFFWLLAAPGSDRGPEIGTPAPAFELTDLAGRKARLVDFRGKVVLVDFWATWCVGCHEELPGLKTLHRRLSDESFAMLAPSLDEAGPEIVARYVAENSVPFRVLFADPKTVRDYRIFGLPTKYLIDRDGIVVKRYLADTPPKKLETDIRALLRRES